MINRPDPSTTPDHDHDVGLEHNHHWACERTGARMHAPLVSDTAAMRIPSSVHHDDAIYAVG